jgi:hypothetical protein
MAQWLRFVLNIGSVNGKRLISEAGYSEWLKPQMKISPDGQFSYGLGWFLQDWNGNKVVQHGGNIDGFNTMVAMIPEKKLGFVLLTNVSASNLGTDLMPVVWENLLGGDTKRETVKTAAVVTPDIKDTGAAKELIGEYTLAAAPVTIEIKELNGGVTFNIPGQQPYTLKETGKDTYSMSPLPSPDFLLKAKRDVAGKVVSVIVNQPGAQPEFVKKTADPNAPTITVDDLMQKTIDALGGAANFVNVKTRIIEADVDLENQGVKAVSMSYSKAPNKVASETTFKAVGKTIGSGWDYFDGSGGGETYSFSQPESFSGKRLDDARLGADFYSPLDWKNNYKKVEIKGMAQVAGEDAWIVSFEPEKGTPFREYYSTKTFLLLKREGVVPSSTSTIQVSYTTTYSDYRSVDRIMIAFKTVSTSVANGNIVTTIRSVRQNVPIEDSVFAPRKVN